MLAASVLAVRGGGAGEAVVPVATRVRCAGTGFGLTTTSAASLRAISVFFIASVYLSDAYSMPISYLGVICNETIY